MQHKCTICNYVYEESQEGTTFNELAQDLTYPVCNAPKEAFESTAAA